MDTNRLAARIVNKATDETPIIKNPAAVELGRLGGLKGGQRRAEMLTPERRREIAEKAAQTRWDKYSLYDEIKATQAACLLVELNGGEMDYAKCIKLLYGIEREALNRWMRPVTFDDLFSMPHGQVVSKALNKAKLENQGVKSFWREHLKTSANNNVHLIKECGNGKLSRAEISLIKEVFEENKHKTPAQLFDEHHNPEITPEWKDPGSSSIKIPYAELLRILGKTPEQIKEFEKDLSELKRLKEMTK